MTSSGKRFFRVNWVPASVWTLRRSRRSWGLAARRSRTPSSAFQSRIWSPSPKDIRERYEVREALELKACELAAGNLKPATVVVLRDLNGRMFAPDLRFVDHAVLDSEFHRLIVEYSGNQRLLRMYSGLKAHVQIARVHYRSTEWRSNSPTTAAEHNMIVNALTEGRAGDAKDAMQRHIRNSMERLISGILHLASDGH